MDDWLDETEEEERAPSCVADDGRLRVNAEMCDTCIFHPGNRMMLASGRLKDMVDSVKEGDSYVVCHKTLSDEKGAVCKGSYDKLYTTPIQIASRLLAMGADVVEWTDWRSARDADLR